MKNGEVVGQSGNPTEQQLEKINKFTRRKFSANEVFVFNVVLCDNEIDRDFERFTNQTLEQLKGMFIGKTGILDHSHKAKNQCARIFDTALEQPAGKVTKTGEQYVCLKAYAYTVRSEQNKNFILDIDAGIKKEVSVGCATAKRVCSVCKSENGNCLHKKGKVYRKNGTEILCYHELVGAADAYEWSFVAVPAQVNAGVTKSFNKERNKRMTIEKLMKSFEQNNEITLNYFQAKELYNEYSAQKIISETAKEYMAEQKRFIVKNICKNLPTETAGIITSVLEKMNSEELIKIYRNAEKTNDKALTQLKKQNKSLKQNSNRNFIV